MDQLRRIDRSANHHYLLTLRKCSIKKLYFSGLFLYSRTLDLRQNNLGLVSRPSKYRQSQIRSGFPSSHVRLIFKPVPPNKGNCVQCDNRIWVYMTNWFFITIININSFADTQVLEDCYVCFLFAIQLANDVSVNNILVFLGKFLKQKMDLIQLCGEAIFCMLRPELDFFWAYFDRPNHFHPDAKSYRWNTVLYH